MKKIIYCLVKIFKDNDKVYADSFLKNGEMYCQALKEIKEIEDNETRGDRYEGLIQWIQPKDIIMTLKLEKSIEGIPDEIIIKENDLAAPVAMQTTEYDSYNVYCMYAIAIDDFKGTSKNVRGGSFALPWTGQARNWGSQPGTRGPRSHHLSAPWAPSVR